MVIEEIKHEGTNFYKVKGKENIEKIIHKLDSGKSFCFVEIIGNKEKSQFNSVDSVVLAEVDLGTTKSFKTVQEELIKKWERYD